MQEIFSNIYDFLMNAVAALGVYGPILGCFLIIIESISWLCTVMGCVLSYFLTKKLGAKYVERKMTDKSILKKFLHYVKNLKTQQLTVIMAIPFTPAFAYNLAAGLANMKFSKFFVTILISKIFLVYFWSEIGTGLVDSLKNPTSLKHYQLKLKSIF